MPRDFKHRVPTLRRARHKPLRAVRARPTRILAGLVLLIILLAGAGKLATIQDVFSTPAAPPVQIGFFKTLPDSETIVTEAEITSAKREARLGAPPGQGLYFLLAGAFTSQDEARQLHDRLQELLKIKPKMEMIQMQHASWFRIRIGPYGTITDADAVRTFLKLNGQDSVMLDTASQ